MDAACAGVIYRKLFYVPARSSRLLDKQRAELIYERKFDFFSSRNKTFFFDEVGAGRLTLEEKFRSRRIHHLRGKKNFQISTWLDWTIECISDEGGVWWGEQDATTWKNSVEMKVDDGFCGHTYSGWREVKVCRDHRQWRVEVCSCRNPQSMDESKFIHPNITLSSNLLTFPASNFLRKVTNTATSLTTPTNHR